MKAEIMNRRNALVKTYTETKDGTPAETVAALVAVLGYDAAVLAVAELVNSVGDWDGRIYDYVRAWAEGVDGAASRAEQDAARIYQPAEIHPLHINQLGAAMMDYKPETAPEAPAEEIPEEVTETSPDALRLGDVVEISGAYFKHDNGLYFVTDTGAAGGSLWLHKIGKTGKVLTSGSASWPLVSYCSDERKCRAARLHNKEHARLSRPEGVPLEGVAEWIRETAAQMAEQIESETRRGWTVTDAERARLEELRQACARFEGVAAPEKKEPEKGIRFYYNGIKVNGGELIKCSYHIGAPGYDAETVTIYADGYGPDLPREYFTVENDSDIMTDYFCCDRAEVKPEHPLYKYVRYAAYKAARRCSWKPDREKVEPFPDPGQPTPEDLQAVEDLKTAAESARIEAEKAARIEEREKYLQQRSAGREYIECVQAAHPVQDGAPVVEIPFSELPAFHAWTESKDRTAVTIKTDGHGRTVSREEKVIEPRRRLLLSVAAADEILRHFDGEVGTDAGYYKTDFIITWTGDDGEENTYSGRYDIGDGDGGLVEHVRSLGRWDLEHAQTDEAREAAQARIDTAEMLARYLPGGEIVKVEFAPWVLSALAAKKKKEEEARERFADTLAAVEMLTDEQLINAVNLAPYADPEKRDVGRFFLQQLAGRDEKKALEVFRRWVKGEEAPLE